MISKSPRVFLSAGEPSGDMHGAAVAAAIRKRWPHAELVGLGGDHMAAQGVRLLAHTRELAVMGLFEVLRHLPFFAELWWAVKDEVTRQRYDLILPLDYPGFNLRLAYLGKRLETPVLYFIAPQVWAWHRSRMEQLAENVDRLAVVLPFEEKLFRAAGANVRFVGHPLLDQPETALGRADFMRGLDLDPANPILALFPGSRLQEVKRQLDLFQDAAARVAELRPGVQPVVAAAPGLPSDLYRASGLPCTPDVPSLLAHARAALVKSGTTTLQTGLAGVPMVITYQMNPLTYTIARHLVEVPHIGLINLIADTRVVPELIQDAATPEALARALLPFLHDSAERAQAVAGLAAVREKLAIHDGRTTAERVVDLAAELLPGL